MLLGLPLAILWLGALVGGIAAGGSDFAFALAASSIWLHRIDPLHSAILCTGCGVLLHLTTGRSAGTSRSDDCGPSCSGVSLAFRSAYICSRSPTVASLRCARAIPARVRNLCLHCPASAYNLRRRASRRCGVGFIGGILGGIGGYSGVLPTQSFAVGPKEITRGVYLPYVIIIQGVTLAGIVLVTFDRTGLFLLLVVLPPLVLGTWIGWQPYGRLNERRFRQALAVLLSASGLTLVL